MTQTDTAISFKMERHDGDMLSILTKATPAEFAQLIESAKQDTAMAKVWLEKVLPKRTSRTPGVRITSATMERAEKVRKDYSEGRYNNDNHLNLFAMITAALLLEHRAALLTDIEHMHQTILAITKDKPDTVYDRVVFDQVYTGMTRAYLGGRR